MPRRFSDHASHGAASHASSWWCVKTRLGWLGPLPFDPVVVTASAGSSVDECRWHTEDMAVPAHVTLAGDLSGEYLVEEVLDDGRLVIRPDTSAEAIHRRLAVEPVSREDFEREFGDLSKTTRGRCLSGRPAYRRGLRCGLTTSPSTRTFGLWGQSSSGRFQFHGEALADRSPHGRLSRRRCARAGSRGSGDRIRRSASVRRGRHNTPARRGGGRR